MKLEDQVCTPEQGEKFKKIGINQDSLFYWTHSEKWGIMYHTSIDVFGNPTSVFTVSELGIMLPDVDHNEFVWASFPDAGIDEEGIDIDPPAFSVFKGPSVKHLEEEPFDNKIYPTEAQARAAFLIYCIENKKITVDEINHRLSTNN